MIDEAALEACIREVCAGRAIFDAKIASPQLWAKAIDRLLATACDGAFDPILAPLAQAFPHREFFAFLAEIARQTATFPAPSVPFADDLTADIQWLPCPGSDHAVLLVCGHAQRLGAHPGLVHRWLSRLGVHLIYVRDFSLRYFTTGIASLGDYDTTITVLKGRLDAAGIKHLMTYGNSAGVYGALKLAIDLKADAVVAVSGPTNLEPLFLQTHGLDTAIDSLIPDHFDRAADLCEALLCHPSSPRVGIWFGADSRSDRLQAENLARYRHAELFPVAGYAQHNLFRELIMRRQYGEVLDWMSDRLRL